jgi:hypothetical protein
LTEDLVLRAVGLLSLPADWRDSALHRARTLLEEEHPGQQDRVALEAKLKRLARLY